MYFFRKDEFFYFDNENELLKINYIENEDKLEELGINKIINGKRVEQTEIYIDSKKYIYFKIFEIKTFYSKLKESISKDSNISGIVFELFDLVLLVKKSQLELFESIYFRYIESIDDNVRNIYSNGHPIVFFDDDYSENILEKLIKNSPFNDDEIIYYDKINKKYNIEKIIITENRNFSKNTIKIKNKEYQVAETGYRERNNKIEINVGRFSFIGKIERTDYKDKLGIPVYRSRTHSYFNKIKFLIQGGKGFSDDMAYNSCVGESIERYASRKFSRDTTVYDSYNNLKNNNFNVINPIEMNIDKDNPNIGKFDKNKRYEWISCLNLKDNKVYLVEASFVFFPYLRDKKDLFNTQTTTGLSSGLSYEEAILQGLLEVVERDSYVIKHKTNNTTAIVSKDMLDSLNIEIIERLSNENIYCNLLTMNGDEEYYTIHCATEDKTQKYPIYTHGCGASLDLNTAVRRAILEAVQLRVSQIELSENKEKYQLAKDTEVYIEWANGNEQFAYIFLEKNNTTITMLKNEDYRSYNFLQDINHLIRQIDSKYVLCADLSFSKLPLKTVRIIVPGYQDMDNKNRKITDRLLKVLGGKEINNHEIFG